MIHSSFDRSTVKQATKHARIPTHTNIKHNTHVERKHLHLHFPFAIRRVWFLTNIAVVHRHRKFSCALSSLVAAALTHQTVAFQRKSRVESVLCRYRKTSKQCVDKRLNERHTLYRHTGGWLSKSPCENHRSKQRKKKPTKNIKPEKKQRNYEQEEKPK